MTDNNEEYYIELEYDDIFNNWYEIEGVRKIKELSRQLRTFFNYKNEVIRYRFGTTLSFAEKDINTTFYTQKQEIESLTREFMTLLSKIKKNGQSLEQGIQSLFYDNCRTPLNRLSEIAEKLSMLLHYFSEESLHRHSKFLKFIVKLAQNIFLVKKCLNAQFSEFYKELEINYSSLERELERLLENTPRVKIKISKKQLEDRLTS